MNTRHGKTMYVQFKRTNGKTMYVQFKRTTGWQNHVYTI